MADPSEIAPALYCCAPIQGLLWRSNALPGIRPITLPAARLFSPAPAHGDNAVRFMRRRGTVYVTAGKPVPKRGRPVTERGSCLPQYKLLVPRNETRNLLETELQHLDFSPTIAKKLSQNRHGGSPEGAILLRQRAWGMCPQETKTPEGGRAGTRRPLF